MIDNTKTFKVGGEVYEIPSKEVEGFLQGKPDAIEVQSFLVNETDTFDIPLPDVEGFVQSRPEAIPLKKKLDSGDSTSDSEDGASGPDEFDYDPSTKVFKKNGQVTTADQVPGYIKETYLAPAGYLGDADVFAYPKAPGLKSSQYNEEDVLVDADGEALLEQYRTAEAEMDSQMSQWGGLVNLVPEEKKAMYAEHEAKQAELAKQIEDNLEQNKNTQVRHLEDIHRGNDPQFENGVIYNLNNPVLYGEAYKDSFGKNIGEAKYAELQRNLLSEKAETNYGIFNIVDKSLQESTQDEVSKEEYTKLLLDAGDNELEGRAKQYLNDYEIETMKLETKRVELARKLNAATDSSEATDIGRELDAVQQQLSERQETSYMFDETGKRVDRAFEEQTPEVVEFNENIDLAYKQFDQTERGEVMQAFLDLSAKEKQLGADAQEVTIKLRGEDVNIHEALRQVAMQRGEIPSPGNLMGAFGMRLIDDVFDGLGLESEEAERMREVVANYKGLYSDNKAKLIAATKVLALNTDPGSIDKGGFWNHKLFLESAGEGFMQMFSDDANIDTDADFITAFGNMMNEAGIPLTEEQEEQIAVDMGDMVASGLGSSIPIMAQIMLTRQIPVGMLSKLKQVPRYKALVTYMENQGAVGKFTVNLAEEVFTGAASFGLTPSDDVTVAMGVGEGTAGAVFQTFFPQSKTYFALRNAFKGAGARGINMGAYSIRTMGGGISETVAEYSGEIIDNAEANGWNWSKALDESIGSTSDEALNKLMATAITCTMFSSAFNLGMLNLTMDEINQKYGGVDQPQDVQDAVQKINEQLEIYRKSEAGGQLSLLDNELFVEGTELKGGPLQFEELYDEEGVRQAGGQVKEVVEGARLFNAPNPETEVITEEYLNNNAEELGVVPTAPTPIKDIDVDNSKAIADAYESMEHDPNNPEVKESYEALSNETTNQYQTILDAGYKIELWEGEGEPYANSAEMIKDVRDNKHMYVFSTEGGFGTEAITDTQREENPLLNKSEFTDINGNPLLVNDLFRFVHDFFGHTELGNGFGAKGEENAWINHSRMFSPLARKAMTTETRGQNSWVNFGPQMRNEDGSIKKKGEEGYLGPKERDFAEQKIGLMPQEFIDQMPAQQTIITFPKPGETDAPITGLEPETPIKPTDDSDVNILEETDRMIDKARKGDKEAQANLEKYGLEWEDDVVVRFVGESEVDALNKGETIKGKSESIGVDVTKDVEGENVPATKTDYRISFKKEGFDDKMSNSRIRMKNKQDGWLPGGYAKSDVSKIEKRNADGTWETIYDSSTEAEAESTPIEPTETQLGYDLSDPAVKFAFRELEGMQEIKTHKRNKQIAGRLNMNMGGTAPLNQAIRNFNDGKKTKALDRAVERLMEMYNNDTVEFIEGTGGFSRKTGVSVEEYMAEITDDVRVTDEAPYEYSGVNEEQLSAHEESGGTTFSDSHGNLEGKPYFSVSMFPELSLIKPKGESLTIEDINNYKKEHEDLLMMDENLAVGTWVDLKTGETVVDIIALIPSSNASLATELGAKYNQKAIYDLEKGKEINTGGDGTDVEGLPSINDRITEVVFAHEMKPWIDSTLDRLDGWIDDIDSLGYSDPFLVTATVRAALVAMKAAIKSGVSIAQAIENAVEYINENKGDSEIFEEDNFRNLFKKPESAANPNVPFRNSDGIVETRESELDEEPVESNVSDAEPESVQTRRDGSVDRMDSAHRRRKKDIQDSKKKFTVEELRRKMMELGFDENYRFKRELLLLAEQEGMTEEALEAIAARELEAGAASDAKMTAERMEKEIRGGIGKSHLTSLEEEALNRVIEAERIIALDAEYDRMKQQLDGLIDELSTMEPESEEYIGTLKSISAITDRMSGVSFDSLTGELKSGDEVIPAGLDYPIMPWRLKHPVDESGEMINSEDAEAYLEKEELTNNSFDKIRKRADKYFEFTNELLRMKLTEGLISQELFDKLSRIKYSPRAFVEHMQNMEKRGITDRSVEQLSAPLKSLQDGSTKSLYNNSVDLLRKQVSGAYRLIHKNRSRRALYDMLLESEGRMDDFAYVVSPEKPMVDGFEPIDVFIDGESVTIAMKAEMSASFQGSTKNMPKWLRWVSGSQILKTFATGINPLFALGNFPRDFVHVVMSTDTYSPFLPVAVVKLSKDISLSLKDAITRGPEYQKSISQGMGMDYLSTEGRIQTEGKGRAAKGLNSIGKALSWFGETSEITVRLAVRRRQIAKRTADFEAKNGRKPNAKELEKIERLATNDSRQTMDFGKGGRVAKQLDTVIPYLNAALQGFKVSAKYIKDNPGTSAVKIAQFGAAVAGLTAYNLMRYRDDWDKISEYEKINNFIIILPIKDKDGNNQYMRVRKDHFMIPFATMFENMVVKNVTGLDPNEGKDWALFLDDEDKSNIVKSWEMATPLAGFNPAEIVTGVPVMDAAYSYMTNYDTFLDREVFRNADDVPDYLEYYPGTSKTFKKLGNAFTEVDDMGRVTGGVSPIRAERAFGKVFTDPKYNIYYQSFDGLYEEMTDGMDKDQLVEFDSSINKGWLEQLGEASYRTLVRPVPENAQDESIPLMQQAAEVENGKRLVKSRIKYIMANEFAKADDEKREEILNTMFDLYQSETDRQLGYHLELTEDDRNDLAEIVLEASIEKELNVRPAIAFITNKAQRNPEAAAISYHYLMTKTSEKYGDNSEEMNKLLSEANAAGLLKSGDTKFNRYLLTLQAEKLKMEKDNK